MCSMVPVLDEADEDARRCVRERSELVSERVGSANRIGAVLATLSVRDYNPLLRHRGRRLAELRTALGELLPANAHAKIKRLLARLELVLIDREQGIGKTGNWDQLPPLGSTPSRCEVCRGSLQNRDLLLGLDGDTIMRGGTPAAPTNAAAFGAERTL